MSVVVGRIPYRGSRSQHRRFLGFARRLAALISDWRAEQRQRRAFNRLNDRLLADIGIVRERDSARFQAAATRENAHDTEMYRSIHKLAHR